VVIDLRLKLALATSKTLTSGIRRLGRGGGTAFPGLVATRIDPRLLEKLSSRLPMGAVVVAGTNGKTTTSRMLANVFQADGLEVVHNRSGSNLVRGISGAFAQQASFGGDRQADIGVIESDENALPDVIRQTRPRCLLLLNLFRDQLDRYGELETIARHWAPAIRALPKDGVLVVNADDPNLAALAEDAPGRVVTFGLQTEGHELPELPHAADAAFCRRCGARFNYDAIYLSHLGAYRCPNCDNRRPCLDVAARRIDFEGMERLRLRVRLNGHDTELDLDVALPGLYNAYNALGVVAVATALEVDTGAVIGALRSFEAAFGRLEKVEYQGRQLTLALSKNPVGFNEVLRMLTVEPVTGPVIVGINDLYADGRDVSWLWDVDFEALADERHTGTILPAGIRGEDLAVRMKYAGLPAERLDLRLLNLPFPQLLRKLPDVVPPGEKVFVLLTYTAMLQLRRGLAEHGAIPQFWKQ
jgi:lipid II isoglutaminyl synthase (glutamine-hydrolysing)